MSLLQYPMIFSCRLNNCPTTGHWFLNMPKKSKGNQFEFKVLIGYD